MQVNVTLIESTESFKSSDDVVNGNVTTVFRGSALGFSSIFVSFADSLEDPSYTFEFAYVIGQPKNILTSKNSDGTYSYKMDVGRVEDTGNGYRYFTETISLNVKKENGEYSVTQN